VRTRVGGFPQVTCAGILLTLAVTLSGAGEPASAELRELLEQNRRLQEQVHAQQKVIAELGARLADIARTSERHGQELRDLKERTDTAPPPAPVATPVARGQQVRIAAEAGLAYFRTGREGPFAEGSFRVDDPVISLEAPVWKNIYFFTELKLLTRETNVEDFELGEIYVDFEDVSARWGQPGLLSFRAGRLNIPFGEEYLVRGPIANPLISHSLSDLWGVDEGVEVYGRLGPARYVVAVLNGGVSRLRDFHSDKSVVARVGFTPARSLTVSGSALRTGKLDTVNDNLSELWFGNAFFRALGPSTTTATFHATLLQADGTARWRSGHASVSLGQARYDDSDTSADNSRRLGYGHVELVQTIAGGLFGAARYSEIRAPGGYPLAGWGRMGLYFFRPLLTEELRRLSLGLGYRFGPPLVFKVEYCRESGRMTTGEPRDQENFFGTELGVRF